MSVVKEMAMKEPLVDNVDQNQIITDHCPLIVCFESVERGQRQRALVC